MSNFLHQIRRDIPSLESMCMQIVKKNIGRGRIDLRGVPTELSFRILRGLNPATLRNIEEYNTRLGNHGLPTEVLWKSHCKSMQNVPVTPDEEINDWKSHFKKMKKEESHRMKKMKSRLKRQKSTEKQKKQETAVRRTGKVSDRKGRKIFYEKTSRIPKNRYEKVTKKPLNMFQKLVKERKESNVEYQRKKKRERERRQSQRSSGSRMRGKWDVVSPKKKAPARPPKPPSSDEFVRRFAKHQKLEPPRRDIRDVEEIDRSKLPGVTTSIYRALNPVRGSRKSGKKRRRVHGVRDEGDNRTQKKRKVEYLSMKIPKKKGVARVKKKKKGKAGVRRGVPQMRMRPAKKVRRKAKVIRID